MTEETTSRGDVIRVLGGMNALYDATAAKLRQAEADRDAYAAVAKAGLTSEKMRQIAGWFDLVDRLLDRIEFIEDVDGETRRVDTFRNHIEQSDEAQKDLRERADQLDVALDALTDEQKERIT